MNLWHVTMHLYDHESEQRTRLQRYVLTQSVSTYEAKNKALFGINRAAFESVDFPMIEFLSDDVAGGIQHDKVPF